METLYVGLLDGRLVVVRRDKLQKEREREGVEIYLSSTFSLTECQLDRNWETNKLKRSIARTKESSESFFK